ncbi:MAG: hypothetical protein LAO05_15345 [Acidobacteriia bacterium]|nr:hypothetical protein [Terriglobia bacterium]
MAAPTRVKLLAGGAMAVAVAATALLLTIPPRGVAAPESPDVAADRAERELPALGVPWGKVRGWERVRDGWTVSWQPAHGMWLVRAWVPDGPRAIRWRIEAASWLPGVRLSARAARALVGPEFGLLQPRERLGRRDWLVSDTRLLGALPAGGDLPADPYRRQVGLEAMLMGLLVAGAAVRHLVPGSASRGWRHALSWAGLVLLPLMPWLAALARPVFQAGVRPWVAELAFGGAATILLGALLFAARRFPAIAGTPPVAWLAAAVAAGVLAGRLEPGGWLVSVAGLPLRLPALASIAVIAGWLAGLAADGLRELLRFTVASRPVVLAALAVGSVMFAGSWLAVAVAIVAAAAVERGQGTWITTAVVWGWVIGSLLALAEWEAGLRDAFVLLLVGAGVVAVTTLASLRAGSPPGEEAQA